MKSYLALGSNNLLGNQFKKIKNIKKNVILSKNLFNDSKAVRFIKHRR